MICETCIDEKHYWFAEDDWQDEDEYESAMDELEKLVGKYAYCDMREVFSTLTGCECGCH